MDKQHDLNTVVIFGASGDLTRRKLIPSLFSLYCKGRLPANFRIIGVSRSHFSSQAFRERVFQGIKEFAPAKMDPDEWDSFAARVSYKQGDLGKIGDFLALGQHLSIAEETAGGAANRLYYLAIAPKLYESTIRNLGAAGLVDEEKGYRRVVIEKPFGRDLPSARALNNSVHESLKESQIYRMDHYLGKETVQNILVFRFANSLFEPVWNRNYIDHVQITASETVDVGHRAGYYDGVGVVQDMVQNHMLQLLSLVAMEPPASFAADALRNEKVKLFASIRHIEPERVAEHTVRGQYRGYNKAKGIDPQSDTATFTALRFYIDNWRWQGVPFFLRSGKALAGKQTSIGIFFKRPPHVMFPLPPGMDITANELTICIQPHEGIHFSFQAKVPDTTADMREVDMSFRYADSFEETQIPDAYERLILDVLKGDASLFTRGDAIELAWEIVDKVQLGWQLPTAPPLVIYERGSWGPAESDRLIDHDGYKWSPGCEGL